MKNYCSILEACEWLAFQRKPSDRRTGYGYKEFYLYQDDEYREKIDCALKILKKILLKFKSAENHIYGCYYEEPEKPVPLKFTENYILDIKNNGIIIEGEHQVNVILLEGEDEGEKHYAPTYTDIEIDFNELKKAKYFSHKRNNIYEEPKKRGRKRKIDDQEFEKYFFDNLDYFEKEKQEACVAKILEKFPEIKRTSAITKMNNCRVKLLSKK